MPAPHAKFTPKLNEDFAAQWLRPVTKKRRWRSEAITLIEITPGNANVLPNRESIRYFIPQCMSRVNGNVRSQSDLDKLVWNIRKLIADLSKFYHLPPGDLIFTGTSAGVGALQAGDQVNGYVESAGEIALTIGPAK